MTALVDLAIFVAAALFALNVFFLVTGFLIWIAVALVAVVRSAVQR